uniref:DNA2/NAM7 helicase-like C-terminal domain-containing protein n=1 Tax=Panagrolaimus sp. ES5 TaxID=591445 RepID=A0AC34F5E6_9BILA
MKRRLRSKVVVPKATMDSNQGGMKFTKPKKHTGRGRRGSSSSSTSSFSSPSNFRGFTSDPLNTSSPSSSSFRGYTTNPPQPFVQVKSKNSVQAEVSTYDLALFRKPKVFLTTIGERNENDNIPSMFEFNSNTKINGRSYKTEINKIEVGDIFCIEKWESKGFVSPSITNYPNDDTAKVNSAFLRKPSEKEYRLSILFESNLLELNFPDPWTMHEKRLTPLLQQQIDYYRSNLRHGLIITLGAVVYTNGSKFNERKNMFLSKNVKTPVEMEHILVQKESKVAAIVSAKRSYQQERILKMKKADSQEYMRMGKLITIAQIAMAARESNVINDAKSTCYDPKWTFEGKIVNLIAKIDLTNENQQASHCYTKGSLISIYLRELNEKTRIQKPLTMIIDNVEHTEDHFVITAKGSLESTLKKFNIENVEELEFKNITVQPIKMNVVASQLAGQMLRNQLNLNDELALKVFHAIFGLKLEKMGKSEEKIEYSLPEYFTSNQKEFIEAVVSGIFSIIACQAPAGCGKTTIIIAAIRVLNLLYPKKICLAISSTNAAVTNLAEGFFDNSSRQPLVLCSVNAIKKASEKEKEILSQCTLSSYIQRLLDSEDGTTLLPDELLLLNDALQLELAIEKDFQKCADDAENNDATIPACILVEEAGNTNPYDDQDDYNDDKKEPSRASIIRAALIIIIAKSPPSFICGTPPMIARMAPAFSGVSEVAFIDEAGTVSQTDAAAILGGVGTIKKLVAVGDIRQLQVYTRDVQDVLLKMGHQSILSILQENNSPGILKTALQDTFRFHPKLVPFIQEICYKDMIVKTNITADAKSGFSDIFDLKSSTPAFIVNVKGRETRSLPKSSKNEHQTNVVITLVAEIEKFNEKRDENEKLKTGIICLYNGQKMQLLQALQNKANVTISSVDSFQGREADIVIVATTRTFEIVENPFFNAQERITVAMTRAKRGLIIVGDVDALKRAPSWSKIVSKLTICDRIPFKKATGRK